MIPLNPFHDQPYALIFALLELVALAVAAAFAAALGRRVMELLAPILLLVAGGVAAVLRMAVRTRPPHPRNASGAPRAHGSGADVGGGGMWVAPVLREAAEVGRWELLLQAGYLDPVGPAVADPGNPNAALLLVNDPRGLAGEVGGRVLLASNGTPDPATGHPAVVAIAVPAHLIDPLAAAVWTYDDPAHPLRVDPAAYAALTRRT